MREFNLPIEYLISQSRTAGRKRYWNRAYTKKTYEGGDVDRKFGGNEEVGGARKAERVRRKGNTNGHLSTYTFRLLR